MQPSVIPFHQTPKWLYISVFILVGVMSVIYWIMKKWGLWQKRIAVRIKQWQLENKVGPDHLWSPNLQDRFRALDTKIENEAVIDVRELVKKYQGETSHLGAKAAPSKSQHHSLEGIQNWLAFLLLEDSALQSLFIAAVEKIDASGFERNVGNLLQRYARELQEESHDLLEISCSLVVSRNYIFYAAPRLSLTVVILDPNSCL
jgi:hypothetical protein